MNKKHELEQAVIRFAGDSGDGMQLTGTLFSNISAVLGNEISTFPDYPAEIRAPQGALGGVSSFQVHLGSGKIYTPGDQADVLVAMNPSALKVNAQNIKKDGAIIYDIDSFEKSNLEKANFTSDNPFEELKLPSSITLIPVRLTTLTKESLADFDLDNKSVLRNKNMFALGLACWLFNQPMEQAIRFLEDKFSAKPTVLRSTIKVLTDGYNYGNNIHLTISRFVIDKSQDVQKGRYTSINGNTSAAFGLIAAAEKAGLPLFLGSYPITPATEVMQELSYRKDLGVKVIQVEDEIAGIVTSIGAAFAGQLAATNTSGPGMALKSEAIGLAVMAELPIVIINVQRSGPSTGLPTKTEQTDLLQALYGRNGECPVVVMAATTPANCFHYAYMASKIALEHQTPVILLTDAFIGHGSSLWKLPKLAELPEIKPNIATPEMLGKINTTSRDPETKSRYWSFPGMEGFEHRNGGLEKCFEAGCISIDPVNHEKMVKVRAEKVDYIANVIPDVEVVGDENADLLVIGWGSTQGHLISAVEELNENGKPAALAHFTYINPLPRNTEEVIRKYKKVVVCELNNGQFATYLRTKVPGVEFLQYNKIQGQPFMVSELVEFLNGV